MARDKRTLVRKEVNKIMSIKVSGAFLATFAVIALGSDALAAEEWGIDPTHSRVGFSVKHMMVSDVRGNFERYAGTVHIDEKNPAKSKVEVTIDTASVDTDMKKRDQHLVSPDFLNAEKFPKMTFESTRVRKNGKGYVVQGKLTIRDVTKPVKLKVTKLTKPVKDPWGKTRRGAHAVAEIDRRDFGLTWNKTLEAGGVLVGEKVMIELDLELVK